MLKVLDMEESWEKSNKQQVLSSVSYCISKVFYSPR